SDLLTNETQRRVFGNNGRSIALAEYSASLVTARHIRLYEALAAGNTAPAGAASARQPSSRSRPEKTGGWFSRHQKASGK
ncbi:MAG: hypothetical protein ACXW34_11585, partial [Nitrospira sp.]